MSKRGQLPTRLFESCAGGGVYLRTPKWSDFDEWVILRRENKEYLKPWEPSWSDDFLTRPSYRTRLAKFKKNIANDTSYPFYVFKSTDDSLVGACNLSFVKRGSQMSCNIGYWIGEKHSRNGFARASVRAMLRFAFEDIGLHRVEAAIRENNIASIQLIEQIGFTREGIARGKLKINGKWRNHIIYAKLSTD